MATPDDRFTIRSGPWESAAIEEFLGESVIPVRLATNGRGAPLVQSLWYVYDDAALWCCTQSDSVAAIRLGRDPRSRSKWPPTSRPTGASADRAGRS